jgi:hypothetical protein
VYEALIFQAWLGNVLLGLLKKESNNFIGSIWGLLIIIRQAIDKNHLRNFEELVIIEEIPTCVVGATKMRMFFCLDYFKITLS